MLAPDTLGEQARRHFLAKLREHYAGLDVSIHRGRFEPDVGIVFDDIRISDPSASSMSLRRMIRIERMVVFANVHPEKLFDKEVPLTTRRVALSGVEANLTLSEDGTPSLAKLIPLPQFGPECPVIDVYRAKINLFSHVANRRPVTAQISVLAVRNQQRIDGTVDRTISIKGFAEFADAFHTEIETSAGANDIRCAVRGFRIHTELFDALPATLQQSLQEVRGLDCSGDATIAVFQSPGLPINYRVRSTIHDGQFAHPKLPRSVSQIQGVVTATPQSLLIEESQIKFGDAIVGVSGRVHGYEFPCDADLEVDTVGFLIDESFAATLPSKLREAWDKLRPVGRINADGNVTCRGGKWDASGTVICNGVDVRYEKFPYPVRQVIGQIEIQAGIATSSRLTGWIDNHRLHCEFQLPIRPGITNEKTFVAAADGPVTIDGTLIKAMTHRGETQSKLESFVRTLRPKGAVHLASVVFGTDVNGHATRKIDLRIIDGQLRYEKFAYPLYNVEGKIDVDGNLVRLVDFHGMSANSGEVHCGGVYRIPLPSSEPNLLRFANSGSLNEVPAQLTLDFTASAIPMDEALRSSLPSAAQQTWDSVAPSGILDQAEIHLTQAQSGDELGIDLTARQLYSTTVSHRTLSLRPCSLPYRIDIAGGTVRYDGTQVTIDSLSGQHAASRLAADGYCVRGNSGRWELTLNLKEGSRLNPDAELIDALPITMREAMRRLQLRGAISLRGATRLTLPDARHPEPNFDWNVSLQLEGNRIADVGPVHSLRGEIRVNGSRDEQGIRASGDIQIDSMHVNDLQITQIRGPFHVVNELLTFGVTANPENLTTEQQLIQDQPLIQGRVFDGSIGMQGNLQLSTGSFDVDMAVHDASVPTLLADLGHSDSDFTGSLSGQARFAGSLGTMDFLKGSGSAKVTGANIYQLPLIMQVLNQLRITPSEDVAFTDGTVEFTMFGDLITFNDLTLWGDWVALQGAGTLDGRRELNLTFDTGVSPQNVFTKVIRPLRGEKYTFWTIDVKGPVHAPTIERRAFEGVSETLELLLPGMNARQNTAEKPTQGIKTWFN
ncbi:AsmA-like C-terminal region-containing protein [Novipirellula artificiosorum]|nr:AsmA-like C-terminal region-containing protein [Novipirellula artificiosorum]